MALEDYRRANAPAICDDGVACRTQLQYGGGLKQISHGLRVAAPVRVVGLHGTAKCRLPLCSPGTGAHAQHLPGSLLIHDVGRTTHPEGTHRL